MISSAGIDFFGISTNSHTRVGDLVSGRVEGKMAAIDNVNLRCGTIIRILWLRF
jgi:hypothetical protein